MDEQTTCPLKFVVVGGSIAGLSAACVLRQAGHEVVVLEKRSNTSRSRGTLRIPPNLARLIETIPGMSDVLKTHGSTITSLGFYEASGNERLAVLPLPQELFDDLGSEFYCIPYDALSNYLRTFSENQGCTVRHDTTVSAVEAKPGEHPAVVTSTGERIAGDIIIGADGRDSLVRRAIEEHLVEEEGSDESSLRSSNVADISELAGACMSVPVQKMLEDPEMAGLATDHAMTIFITEGMMAVGSRAGEIYSLGFTKAENREALDYDTDWEQLKVIQDAYAARIAKFKTLQKVMALGDSAYLTIQAVPKLIKPTDNERRLVVIGDAAHACLIHATANSSLAVEDAYVLGKLFSHLTKREQIPMLFDGFHEIRHQRTNDTQTSELHNLMACAAPEGPRRDRWVASLKAGDGAEADNQFAEAYTTWITQFNYDANEAVEEWWMNWGKFVEQGMGAR